MIPVDILAMLTERQSHWLNASELLLNIKKRHLSTVL